MGDTKDSREKKGRGKEAQRREHDIEEELEADEAAQERVEEHEKEELELDLGRDED